MGGAHQETVPYTDREVDALLAERVLGWEREPLGGKWFVIRTETGNAEGMTKSSSLQRPPDFAHDIRAAMLLFFALPNLNGDAIEIHNCKDELEVSSPTWTGCPPRSIQGLAAAIRLAALKALELLET